MKICIEKIDFSRLSFETLSLIYIRTTGLRNFTKSEEGRQQLAATLSWIRDNGHEIRLPADTAKLETEMCYDTVHSKRTLRSYIVMGASQDGSWIYVTLIGRMGLPEGESRAVLRSDYNFHQKQAGPLFDSIK